VNRLDRALGILLLLRAGEGLSAAALARRFEVSPRTIYRDVETLSTLGVPIYAQRGRGGGFRLLEGYFLPPVTFTQSEALVLVVGLALLCSLRAKPFAADLQTARDKLVAAVPDALRAILVNLQRHIGFEMLQEDIFHPEPADHAHGSERASASEPAMAEDEIIGVFVRAVVSRAPLALRYRSPYRAETEILAVAPLGAFWDRGYWYLVGMSGDEGRSPRLWRADRVLSVRPQQVAPVEAPEVPEQMPTDFDVRDYLDRRWLAGAMRQWAKEAPVRVRLARQQAERLRRDWYYRWAEFESTDDGGVSMTFGEEDPQTVLELLRWLGPGAELLAPQSWRTALATQLSEMLARYR
jgi:predicted DNA-binding transcriptional regulator YafY